MITYHISRQMREQAIEVCDILASIDFNQCGCLPTTICRDLGYGPCVAALCDAAWNPTGDPNADNALTAQLLREGFVPTDEQVRTDERFHQTKFKE